MDESWPWEDDVSTQIGNQPCNTTPECSGEERPTVTKDTMPDASDGVGAQASEPSHPEVTPTPSTGLSATGIEQQTQRFTDYTFLKTKTHQPRQLHKKAEEGELMPLQVFVLSNISKASPLYTKTQAVAATTASLATPSMTIANAQHRQCESENAPCYPSHTAKRQAPY